MKANQITAIGVSIIALFVVYIFVNGLFVGKQYQNRKQFMDTNTFCREKANEGIYKRLKRLDLDSSAWKFLTDCMKAYGYENVECGYDYGVCEQK